MANKKLEKILVTALTGKGLIFLEFSTDWLKYNKISFRRTKKCLTKFLKMLNKNVFNKISKNVKISENL